MRIGCPQCNNPIDALDRDRLNGITCPVCESALRVLWDPAWAERGGLVVGPMTLEQQIRVSFYGDVYQGYHPAHGPVAVTILSKRDTRRKWNFIDDGRLLSRMGHHARIAKVFGVGEDDEYYYQVSSLADQGKDLAASMAEVYPTADEAAGRIADVAEDLHKAHGENVIHGSICPATFLVGELNKVCLVDFTMGRRDLEQVTVNTAGRVLDSAAFASPEQIAGRPVDQRSDVYGLGALLYLMLTGWPPYLGSLARVKEQVLAGDPRPPSSLVPSVPPVLELICMKALARTRVAVRQRAGVRRGPASLPQEPAGPGPPRGAGGSPRPEARRRLPGAGPRRGGDRSRGPGRARHAGPGEDGRPLRPGPAPGRAGDRAGGERAAAAGARDAASLAEDSAARRAERPNRTSPRSAPRTDRRPRAVGH